MGDDDEGAIRAAQRVDAVGNDPQRVDVETGIRFVEDAQARLNSAICRISLRFFSPPEKPTLSARFSISIRDFSEAAASRTLLMKSGVDHSASPRALRCAFSAALEEVSSW